MNPTQTSYQKYLLAFVIMPDKVLLPGTCCAEHTENMALSKEGVYRLIQVPCALYANCDVAVIYQSQEVRKFSYSNCNSGNRS